MDNPTTDPIAIRVLMVLGALGFVVAMVAGFRWLSATDTDAGGAVPGSPVEVLANDDGGLGSSVDTPTSRPVLTVTAGSDLAAGRDGSDSDEESGAPAAETATTPAPPTTAASAASTEPSTTTTASTSTPPSTSGGATESTGASPAADSTSPSASGAPSSAPVEPAGEGLSEVELEIARLTNELRTDPNGPLRREGPSIDCGGRLTVDPETGRYDPVPAVEVDVAASLQVARPWSSQMTTELVHQPEAGIPALIEAGIEVMTAGENIAYHNFPDTAFRHFAGWRESDGHFCNLMDPAFTHLGVGEVIQSDGFSYATQNFFALQGQG